MNTVQVWNGQEGGEASQWLPGNMNRHRNKCTVFASIRLKAKANSAN